MVLADDGDRRAGLSQFERLLDFRAVRRVQPLIVADAADHEEVELLVDAAADLATALNHKRFAVLSGAVCHDASEYEDSLWPFKCW